MGGKTRRPGRGAFVEQRGSESQASITRSHETVLRPFRSRTQPASMSHRRASPSAMGRSSAASSRDRMAPIPINTRLECRWLRWSLTAAPGRDRRTDAHRRRRPEVATVERFGQKLPERRRAGEAARGGHVVDRLDHRCGEADLEDFGVRGGGGRQGGSWATPGATAPAASCDGVKFSVRVVP